MNNIDVINGFGPIGSSEWDIQLMKFDQYYDTLDTIETWFRLEQNPLFIKRVTMTILGSKTNANCDRCDDIYNNAILVFAGWQDYSVNYVRL